MGALLVTAFAKPWQRATRNNTTAKEDRGWLRSSFAAVRPLARLVGLLLIVLGMAAATALAQGTGVNPAAGAGLPGAPAGSVAPATPPSGTWDRVALFVINPWATIALLVVGCLLLFIDLLTPFTWGMTGTLGVLAVGLVFAGHLHNHTGAWIGIVLLLGGVTFLLLETHVFPGHGIAAVAGLLLTFLGMFWSLGGSQNALFAITVSTVLTVVTLIAFFAYLPKSPIWKQLGQEMRQHASLGYVTSESRMYLLGRTGRALTVLRPAGMVDIDGLRVDVVTEGEFLDAGTPIIVAHVEGMRVVVERCGAAETAPNPEDKSRPSTAAAA